MVGRTCLDCGTTTNGAPRCPTHTLTHRRNQPTTTQRGYGTAWQRHARQAIARYRHTHGDTCPGWHRSPHPVAPNDWVCDHDDGPMCRSCNATKAATADRARARARRAH